MSITAAAIRNNRVTFLGVFILLVGGIGAYRTLPRAEDPGFIVRTALVQTFFPGASPERVEQLVTDVLEERIQEIPELDFASSESRTGTSLIFVNIRESFTHMRPIWDDLRRKIDAAVVDLPEGVMGPYVNDEFGDVYPIMLTVTGPDFTYRELKDVADDVRDRMLRIPDVAKVDIYGAQEERIFVETNNARLAELGVSPVQLRNLLASQNIINPGGTLTADRERIALEPSGNFESIEDLKRTILHLPGHSELVALEDIAYVYRGYIDPPRSVFHSTGRRALGLSVSMREGGDVIALGDNVRAVVDEFLARFPIGLDFDLVVFQPEAVRKQVNGFIVSLGQAVAIVLAVMLVSLGVRTGLAVASLIPMAILTTLMVMQTLGIGLDQMSIAALIIALGMLVDNAIVISESIMVQMSQGKDRLRAAVDSAQELRIPLLTSSLTTSAAFLPIFLAESSTGEYTASLFKVVTIALLASWVLSLTMMPLLCMIVIRVKTSSESYESRFYRAYRGFLVGCLRRRTLSLGVLVGVFALAMFGMRFVPKIFFPAADNPRMTIELDLPLGTPIEDTETLVDEIEQLMREELLVGEGRAEGLTSWSTYIGSQGGPRYRLSYNPAQAGSEHASFIANATSRDAVDEAIRLLDAHCRRNYPDLTAQIWAEQLGPPIESPVQIRLFGDDVDRLFEIADETKAQLRAIPGTKNIDDDWGPQTKKIEVNVNQARARRAGVSSQDIAISLQTAFSGLQTTEFREADQTIPITLRSVAADRQDIGKLETLNVYAQATGSSVPLKQVADLKVVWEPSKILRRERTRTVTVQCDVEGTTALAVIGAIDPWLTAQAARWGGENRFQYGGEIESSVKANQSIGAKLPIAFFLILLLMVVQFNSMRRTAIVLLTIPLGLIGVTAGLLSTGASFGFMTFLGVISLAGIIINNAIVLLDRIRIEIEENGLAPERAIVASAERRLRPIILTTCTTVGGLLPLWFGGGPMWEPMAIAIIFGLLFATVLTLGVVPILYSMFFRVNVAALGNAAR